MRFYFLRYISFASLLALVLLLTFFSNLNSHVIISAAVIMLFLMIFTYIFKIEGSSSLKVSVILSVFIFLPLFILVYLGIFDVFPGLFGFLALIIVALVGLYSIVTIIRLDYVELKWDDG